MTRQKPIELFMPPNVLKAKAGGGGGGFDLAAIKRAEQAMQDLKGEFRGWAADDLKKLVAARDAYDKSGSDAARAALLRCATDLKAQAGSFDFPLIARIAASLAKLMGELPVEAELPPGLADAHVDAIQVIFRQNIADEKNEIARLLCTELDARVTEALRVKTR